MKLVTEFRVHGVNTVEIPTTVEVEGETMVANVRGVEIELAGVHPWDGAPKLRFAASHIPSAPASAVVVSSSMPSSIQPSWPASATTDSPGVRCTSSTGIVVPRITASMPPYIGRQSRVREGQSRSTYA